MQAVKGKGTKLEQSLFAMLEEIGLSGWERNVTSIVGAPDALFPEERVIIFIDGCFWHGCPHCNRPLPVTNHDYWERKIERTKARDKKNRAALTDEGWTVISIWEHEMRDPSSREQIAATILTALERGRLHHDAR